MLRLGRTALVALYTAAGYDSQKIERRTAEYLALQKKAREFISDMEGIIDDAEFDAFNKAEKDNE